MEEPVLDLLVADFPVADCGSGRSRRAALPQKNLLKHIGKIQCRCVFSKIHEHIGIGIVHVIHGREPVLNQRQDGRPSGDNQNGIHALDGKYFKASLCRTLTFDTTLRPEAHCPGLLQ